MFGRKDYIELKIIKKMFKWLLKKLLEKLAQNQT